MESYRSSMHRNWSVNLRERPSREILDLRSKGKIADARTGELRRMLTSSDKVREATAAGYGNNIAATAHRGEPFAYDLFYSSRMMHDQIPRMQILCDQGAFTSKHHPHSREDDQWVNRFGGLSFLDIEQMELDSQTHRLAQGDIERINKMFRLPGIIGFGRADDQGYTLQNLIFFASQQVGRQKVWSQRILEKFQDNITAYFDYYTDFITDFNRDSTDDRAMLLMLVSGKSYLPIAVATYIPTRLNITPSSARKLYIQRELLSDPSNKLLWEKLGTVFLDSFSQAYRDDVFPEDLEQFQHYNSDTDSAAALKLTTYMESFAISQQQAESKVDADKLLEQWSRYKKDIAREVMRDPKTRIVYQMPNDHPAENVTMITNKDTFIFIMRFSDNVHLTLELDKAGRLFGVPPSLVKSYPQMNDILLTNLLTPLLEKYKVKDVSDSNKQGATGQISATSESSIVSDLSTLAEVTQKKVQVIKSPKRKRLVRSQTIFKSDASAPLAPKVSKAERSVAYSDDKVRKLLGPRVARQQFVVDQALKVIDDFEHGNIRFKRLKGHRGLFVRIRTGDFRIHLKRLGGRNYELNQVVNRNKSYKNS